MKSNSSKERPEDKTKENSGVNKSPIADIKPCSSKMSEESEPKETQNEPKESSRKAEVSNEQPRDETEKINRQNQNCNPQGTVANDNWSPFGGYFTGCANFPFPSAAPRKSYANSDEYFADLRLWLQQAVFWQSLSAAFPYFMMCQQFGQIPPQFPTSTGPPGTSSSSNVPVAPQVPHFPQFSMAGFQYPRQEQPPANRPEIIDGVECRIPSFWKRIAAEFIDFLLLFFVKIAVTYVAVDFFHFVEMDTFDLFQKDVKLAYKTFIQITQDIVILEMIHRLVVCAFETFWLIGGQNGRIGGSTPGKSIMGLRVITCESSSALREGDDRVVVKPGGNLGLGTAFLRALTKNFVLALLIPTSFAFIFFPHNRTGYDMICNTIVVEEPVIPHRAHQD